MQSRVCADFAHFPLSRRWRLMQRRTDLRPEQRSRSGAASSPERTPRRERRIRHFRPIPAVHRRSLLLQCSPSDRTFMLAAAFLVNQCPLCGTGLPIAPLFERLPLGPDDYGAARTRSASVIPPFLVGVGRRIHAAAFSFWAGGIAPAPRRPAMVCLQTMKGMFGRSVLQAHGHCVAKSWASRWPAGDCLQSSRGSMVSMMCGSSRPCLTVRF